MLILHPARAPKTGQPKRATDPPIEKATALSPIETPTALPLKYLTVRMSVDGNESADPRPATNLRTTSAPKLGEKALASIAHPLSSAPAMTIFRGPTLPATTPPGTTKTPYAR